MKEKKLKKLYIITRSMKAGGCEHVIAQLANRFCSEGIEVSLFTVYRHDSFYPLDGRISVRPLNDREEGRSRDTFSVFSRFRKYVRDGKPDAVLAMPDMVNVWTSIFLAGTGVPVIVSERNDPARFPASKMKRLLRRPAYWFARGVVFQTHQQKAFFPKRIQDLGTIIDNPLDAENMPPAYSGQREKTVVTAARLASQKNLMLLIGAFRAYSKTHPDWKLIIYGEGPERERLENAAGELLNGTVFLPGENKELAEAIRMAGMFVLSSDYEGMPNALIEAMALGIPCVSTDCPVGGPASLIQQEENGILVRTGDAAGMTDAMSRIADDPALAASIGKNAEQIRRRLEIGAVADKWRSYIEKVIEDEKERAET